MQFKSVPITKQSMPHRGLDSTSSIWMQQKSNRDVELWGNQNRFWIVDNKLYDLSNYIQSHPGGKHWLTYTQGQDITQHFYTHHLNEAKAKSILEKYYVSETKIKQKPRFTYDQDGLFRKIKNSLLSKYSIKQLQDSSKSVINGIQLLTIWILFFILAAYFQSFIFAFLCGMVIYPLTGVAHNFVHMKPHPFKYLYLLTGFTHQEWQRMHCLSHHSYANTLLDYQIQALQPIVYYLKIMPKNKPICALLKEIAFTFLAPLNIILKLVIIPIIQQKLPEWFYMSSLFQIPLMYCLNFNLALSIQLYLVMHISFSIIFSKLTFIGHRTGREWTQGNDEIMDFAQHQISASTDIKTKFSEGFFSYLFYSGFNNHAIHHIFPTVDNHKLTAANFILKEQAQKKGIKTNEVPSLLTGLIQIQNNFFNRKQWKKSS